MPRERAVEFNGPSSTLISRLKHLELLFTHLPASIPLNPAQSSYSFGLDQEDLEDGGPWMALNRNLEVCFRTHELKGQPLLITERGKRLHQLIEILRKVIKDLQVDADRDLVRTSWIERLIAAAQASGAKIPQRKRPSSASDQGSGGDKGGPGSGRSCKKLCSARTVISVEPTEVQPVVLEISDEESEDETTSDIEGSPMTSQLCDQKPVRGIQQTFPAWTKITTEAERQASHQREKRNMGGVDWEKIRAGEEKRQARAKEEKKADAAARQRKHRQKAKAKKVASTKRDPVDGSAIGSDDKDSDGDVDMISPHNSDIEFDSAAVASTSRTGATSTGLIWREQRNGKYNGAKQQRASRTNWFHAFLFPHIDRAARKNDWSSAAIVKDLKENAPQLFKNLRRGTVHRWMAKDGKRALKGWSAATKDSAARGRSLAASGRAGILARYPEVTEPAVARLRELRSSGLPVNVFIARSVLLSFIHEKQPTLLEKFKCSEKFIRAFLASKLNWTPRKGTRQAAKLPDNVTELCERAFMRLVYVMKWENVPAKLVISMDQTGVYLLPGASGTFEEKGARQVDVVAKDEKRAFTLCVSTTASGDILPFQQVWAGASEKSIPTAKATRFSEAKEYGFDFAFAKSEKRTSHYSTLKTMKEYIENIVVPYADKVVANDPTLDDNQKYILLLDCYPVHIGAAFRQYCKDEHPRMVSLFVPANCTSIFQPADVGQNRIIKHRVKQQLMTWMTEEQTKALRTGLSAEDFKLTTSLPVLRDAQVAPIVDVYEFMSSSIGREVILKSWAGCKVPERPWTLSADCLVSQKAQAALVTYLKNDTLLREEVSRYHQSSDALGSIKGEEALEQDDDIADDSDISMADVLKAIMDINVDQDAHGIEVAGAYCVSSCSVMLHTDGNKTGLAADDSVFEDIWAWDDNGHAWGESNLPMKGSGTLDSDNENDRDSDISNASAL